MLVNSLLRKIGVGVLSFTMVGGMALAEDGDSLDMKTFYAL